MRFSLIETAAAAILAACSLATAAAAQDVPRAQVSEGALLGIRQANVAAFLGVPYAAPPVGALRWRSPQPAISSRAIR